MATNGSWHIDIGLGLRSRGALGAICAAVALALAACSADVAAGGDCRP